MEPINIVFDGSEFDRLVHDQSLPQSSTITLAVKDKATVTGNPGVVIAFDVALPDGNVRRAQATTTLRGLKRILEMINFRYPTL